MQRGCERARMPSGPVAEVALIACPLQFAVSGLSLEFETVDLETVCDARCGGEGRPRGDHLRENSYDVYSLVLDEQAAHGCRS